MEHTPYTSPPHNASLSSPAPSLCPTAVTLFFVPTLCSLLFLTALPGNVLSLWVFLRCISKTSPTHVYLFHLSISNLMLCLNMPFLAAYYARGSFWRPSNVLCQLVVHGITPLLHINIYLSLTILTLVAFSRFAVLIQHTHASRPSTCTKLLPHGFFARLMRTSFASRACAVVWLVAIGGIVPVTVYYSAHEAAAGEDGEAGKTGHAEVCYSPAVELGGSVTAAFTVTPIIIFFVFYLMVLLSYMTVLRHIERSRRSTNVSTSQSLLVRVRRNIVVIQLKSCLLLLTALRGSSDPLMYFLLDKTFRHQTLRLLRGKQSNSSRQTCSSVTPSANQKIGQLGDVNVATATVDLSHEGVL